MAKETRYKMSAERLEELKQELEYLQTVREKEVAEQIKEARSFGDLSEKMCIRDSSSTFPLLAYFQEDSAVPKLMANLFVPSAAFVGSPAIIYAGMDIMPPPPATESTNPAKNTSGQTIRHVLRSSGIKIPPFQ